MQGFGDSRRLTLIDLVTRLRMRLSEPNVGTWGVVTYEFDEEVDGDGNLVNKQEVNELVLMLNEAQDFLCRDLYDREFAFFESEFRHPIIPMATQITLPPNFMAIESAFHYQNGEFTELEQAKIKHLLRYDEYGNSAYFSQGGYYLYYEVRGNMGETIHEEQIPITEESSEDTATYTMAMSDKTVFVGDTVCNETDGSTGQIVEKHISTIVVDLLSGGRTNTFEPGDIYSIETAAQPYESLNLYPRLTSILENKLWEGLAGGWKVEYPRKPTRIRFRLNKIPEGINPETVRILLAVQKSGETEAAVSGVLSAELKQGWNDVFVSGELEGKEKYYVKCYTNDYNSIDETGHTFTPDRVEVYQATGKDFLSIAYTRLPKPMGAYDNAGNFEFHPNTVCEFPPYCAEALIAYARQLAYMKKSGMGSMHQGMLVEYKSHVEDILKFLRKRGESGNRHNMFTNTHTHSGGNKHPYVLPGFTNDVRFP